MRKTKFILKVTILAVMYIMTTHTFKSFGQLPYSDPAYELVFSDDFNGTKLDSAKWLKRFPWHQSTNIADWDGCR